MVLSFWDVILSISVQMSGLFVIHTDQGTQITNLDFHQICTVLYEAVQTLRFANLTRPTDHPTYQQKGPIESPCQSLKIFPTNSVQKLHQIR